MPCSQMEAGGLTPMAHLVLQRSFPCLTSLTPHSRSVTGWQGPTYPGILSSPQAQKVWTELISMLWLLSTPALPAQPPWLQTQCTLDSYFTSYHLPRVHPVCCLPCTNSSLGRGPMGLPLWPVAGGCSLVPLGLAPSN